MFAGYKTYITAAVTIIGAVAAYLTGEISVIDMAQLIVPALLGTFIRNGMSK
jgi:hypothetical protein